MSLHWILVAAAAMPLILHFCWNKFFIQLFPYLSHSSTLFFSAGPMLAACCYLVGCGFYCCWSAVLGGGHDCGFSCCQFVCGSAGLFDAGWCCFLLLLLLLLLSSVVVVVVAMIAAAVFCC